MSAHQIIVDTAKELGCEPDNEAILQAISDLKDEVASSKKSGQPIQVTDQMAYAFNSAIGDASLSESDVEEIKKGLAAALCDIANPGRVAELEAQTALDQTYIAEYQMRIDELQNQVSGLECQLNIAELHAAELLSARSRLIEAISAVQKPMKSLRDMTEEDFNAVLDIGADKPTCGMCGDGCPQEGGECGRGEQKHEGGDRG